MACAEYLTFLVVLSIKSNPELVDLIIRPERTSGSSTVLTVGTTKGGDGTTIGGSGTKGDVDLGDLL